VESSTVKYEMASGEVGGRLDRALVAGVHVEPMPMSPTDPNY
jgi:hypothetical protein